MFWCLFQMVLQAPPPLSQPLSWNELCRASKCPILLWKMSFMASKRRRITPSDGGYRPANVPTPLALFLHPTSSGSPPFSGLSFFERLASLSLDLFSAFVSCFSFPELDFFALLLGLDLAFALAFVLA